MDDSRDQIQTAIHQYLVGRGLETKGFSAGADLAADLGLDSLDLVELMLNLEERFGIEIPDNEMEGVTSVTDVVDLVVSKLSVGA